MSAKTPAVILSVYRGDRLKFLREALESLYRQEPFPALYVQCDGPVDPEIEKYLETERVRGRIAYLGRRRENLGLAKSLNELLERVMEEGHEYIARMDADDIAVPDRFRKQLRYLETHPEIDVVGGAIEEFSDDGGYHKIVCYPPEHKQMYLFFRKRVPLAHVSAMFRRSFFEKAGYYPTPSPTNEDTLLWMRGFAAGCRFANLPDILVKVRISNDFFLRRGGGRKAWSDFCDRLAVIRTLGYNWDAYFYAVAMLGVNLAPGFVKKILYKKLR
ncbi:glycosyltransferase [Nitratifractor sp.]|uniref:glycosyltransferase n=1 Tax=Nitratifractor sp. TaxID=2268144 RepID=UPI0025E11649|nr:glycosyltransferase [Nitratifractor sp.]